MIRRLHPPGLFSLLFPVLLACGPATAGNPSIPAIQGAAHESRFAGSMLSDVQGVVTATREGSGRHGFFLQDPAGDGDPATSDGIFVATGDLPAAVSPGDLVAVTGRVEEAAHDDGQLSQTRIATHAISGVRVLRRGGDLPAPVVLGAGGRVVPNGSIDDDGLARFEPDRDAIDFWESLEGMRVAVPRAVVVGPTTAYRQIAVLVDEGTGSEPRTAAGGVARRGADENSEIVLLSLPRGHAVEATVGDRFAGSILGVVEYDFGAYQVVAEAPLPVLERSVTTVTPTDLVSDGDHLTVASFNVENLSLAGPPERVERAARVIADTLRSPDVVALQEIQDDSGPDDDGTVSAAGTLRALTAAVRNLGGRSYRWIQLDPRDGEDGGQPGGNIRVAVLYDPERLDLVRRGDPNRAGVAVDREGRIVPSPGRIGIGEPCFEATRKSLALELTFRGCPLVLVNNHWSSKRGDDRAFGSIQPPRRATEPRRTCQATVVAELVRAILDRDPGAGIVVLGDLNEHEDRPPVDALREAGLRVLVDAVEAPQRYTYNYRGNSQVLDHIAVSPALAEPAPEVEILHVHADRAAADRASDHDPLLARLRWGGGACG